MLWQMCLAIGLAATAVLTVDINGQLFEVNKIHNANVDVTEQKKTEVHVFNANKNTIIERLHIENRLDTNEDQETFEEHNQDVSSITLNNDKTITDEIALTNAPTELKIENTISATTATTSGSVLTDPCLSNEEIHIDSGSKSVEVAYEVGKLIETEYGEVHGYFKHGNTDILSFLDIPYGKFTHFFEAPRYPDKWERVHAVYEHVKRCPQYDGTNVVGDLDCLTLSVFTPQNVSNAKVLFHIHDGNFDSGSGDESIYGPQHLVAKGIILVLPNYRLGPLGFLCLRNETAPGNAALKDLTLALDWTRKNIEAFGGDPFDIAVSGEGSGGALAMYLALSPISKVYVSKVITESGSALSHWALDRRPIVNAILLAGTIQVEIETLTEIFENVDLETLIKASKGLEFRPCIENRADGFITESPWKILYGYKTNITFMIGTANHAGMKEALAHTNNSLEILNEDLSLLLPTDLTFHNQAERSEVSHKIQEQYFGENITMELITNLSLCYTDISYTTPVIRTVRALVEAGATVYLYEFSYVGNLNREHDSLTSLLNGAAKGDIIGYAFSQDDVTPQEESDEVYMVDLITDLWVNFMKTGIPSGEDVTWNEVNKTEDFDEEWLSIGAAVTSETGLHVERMRLWTEIYDKYYIERNHSVNLKHDRLYFFLVSLVGFGGYRIF